MSDSFSLGDITLDIYDDSTRITFPDGWVITGAPEDTESYLETATLHGYGSDTLRLCQDHEVMHIALCHWLGIDSPTMTLLQNGGDEHLIYASQLEEAAILAVQHFAREMGVDLIQRMKQWGSEIRDSHGPDYSESPCRPCEPQEG